MDCQHLWIWLKVQNKSNFANFWQFSLKRSNNFSLFCVCRFVGMILITCQEMGLIELLEMSFSRSEMSGLVHFHLIIHNIQCISSCSFFVVVTLKVIFKVV